MTRVSPDAARIMRCPAIHVPGFASRVTALASDPQMTFERAIKILDAEMQAAGVTELDFEMAQPGNAFRIPFALSAPVSPEGQFQQSVSQHVAEILRAQK